MGMIATGCCGDEYPSDMVFEGESDKYYCAWCLGLDPFVNEDLLLKMSLDDKKWNPTKITLMFWENFRKD